MRDVYFWHLADALHREQHEPFYDPAFGRGGTITGV
jgi:hypothetical protein